MTILLVVALGVLPALSCAHAHQMPPPAPNEPVFAEAVHPYPAPGPAQTPVVHAPARTDGNGPVISLLVLLGVMAALASLRGTAWRRTLTWALVLFAVVFTYESGVHSVHHLGSPSAAAHCAVAVAVSSSPGVVGQTADVGLPCSSRLGMSPASVEVPIVDARPACRGRAPPAFLPTSV